MDIQKYETNAIGIIKGAEILSAEDVQAIDEMREELKDVFIHSQVFRTETEMKISVLKDMKHPTPDSKYWQAVREQNVMFQELVLLSYEYRKRLIEIKKLKAKMERETDELDKELLQIEIEKQEFLSKNEEKTAKDRIREIKLWHSIKQDLIPEMKYSLQDVNEHQLEAYSKRFQAESAIAERAGSLPERINAIGLNDAAQKALNQKLLK